MAALGKSLCQNFTVEIENKMQQFFFGPWKINASEIFFTSKYSFGLINLKPVVPGHVLIIPRRVVKRYSQLTIQEVHDLFQSAQTVAKQIESRMNASSLTFTIQDGPEAGQSVPHVHLHLIPRVKDDWLNNDDIYQEINQKEIEMGIVAARESNNLELMAKLKGKIKGADIDRLPREQSDMAREAHSLRVLFDHYDNIWDSKYFFIYLLDWHSDHVPLFPF